MTRRLLLIPVLLAATGMIFAACGDSEAESGSGESGSAEAASGTLTVCSDIPYPPMEFEADPPDSTPSGYTGFDIDLVQAIADGAGKDLEVQVTPFDGIFAAMDAGSCDAVVSSVSITPEREENMDFTEPYFTTSQSILTTTENESTYDSMESLAGKKIGVQSGTTGEEFVNAEAPDGAEIIAYPTGTEVVTAVTGGLVDASIQDYSVNGYAVTQNDGIVVSAKVGEGESYGMAVKKGNTETLTLLDDGLTTAKDDGTYAELYKKYFGEEPPA